MVFLLFLMGIALVGAAGRLVARAVLVPRLQLKAHLRNLQEYGFETAFSDSDISMRERLGNVLAAVATRLGRGLMSAVPTVRSLAAGELTAAGFYDISPETVHGYRFMAALGLPLIFGLLLGASGSLAGLGFVLVIASAAAGWILPSSLIRRRGSARLEEIDHRLPELIDLLIATVEAGMAFTAALDMVAQRFQGAIGGELRLTMQQQSLGMSMQQALNEMAERCDTPSVRSFTRTAARGETMGVSIGPVLRELSSDQRRRHRMAAREKMQKAPVKMIFPLMFLIFPALMIVLMFPAAYSVTTNLKGIF